jgi:excinuclease UvrABC nuclease subunit
MNIKEQIEAIEIAIAKKPCVYFLTDEAGEILYVGKSKSNTIGRISAHGYDKQFSRAFFINCQGYKEMDDLESKLILKIKPKYNRSINKHSVGLITVGDIKKIMKIDVRFIRKAASEYNVGMTMIGSCQYYEKDIIEALIKHIRSLEKRPISIDNDTWESIRGKSL